MNGILRRVISYIKRLFAKRRPAAVLNRSVVIDTASSDQCYMCEALATSREHVPPLAIFPEFKDLGLDLRRGLITVPSCAEHNSRKSQDDEYFHFAVLLHIGNNLTGKRQFASKLLRAVKRSPATYGKFIQNCGPLLVEEGQKPIAGVVPIDRKRFDRCVEHIAHGLYFHTSQKRWAVQRFSVTSPDLFMDVDSRLSPHMPSIHVADITSTYLENTLFEGKNPEVFRYRLRSDPSEGVLVVELIFYGALRVYAYSSPAIQEEFNRRRSGG